MRALSAPQLLDVWEQGRDESPVQQALMLLAASCPEATLTALADLSLGRRNARLLTLREWIFGPQLLGVATCPSCCEQLEMTLHVADLRALSPAADNAAGVGAARSLEIAGHEIHFRLPNSADLLAAVTGEDPTATERMLLYRCLLTIRHNGNDATPDQLPTDVLAAVVEQIAQADPQGDVQLALTCPWCSHQWQETFDIAAFFWTEISAWATQVLREVHILASAYGWREADILRMSARRRQAYLELVEPGRGGF